MSVPAGAAAEAARAAEGCRSRASGPLAGLHVLELADEKGLYCGKLFADLGADVIKVEAPGGDATRRIPPLWRGRDGCERSLYFLCMNTGKRSVTLDLEQSEGRGLFRLLLRRADVLIETARPDQLEAWGFTPENLLGENPRLVWTSVTPFGHSGPRRNWRACDLVASALGGALHTIGASEDAPVRLAGRQACLLASLCAAVSSLFALHGRHRTGRGQRVDISMQEAVVAATHICGVGKWLDDGIVPKRRGPGLFASVPSGVYPCRDGLAYLMVNRPAHWKALAEWIREVTGREEVCDPLFEGPSSRRLPYRDLLDVYITELSARYGVEDFYREGQSRHLAITPVWKLTQVVADPQLAARGAWQDVEQADGTRLRMLAPPYRMTGTPAGVMRRAPEPGEHNEAVWIEELGFTRSDLARWRARGLMAP